jgi:7-carboxy-7-deazaguanine synthase (Cx14CxxC type)
VGTNGTRGGKFRTARELAERIASLWPTADTKHRLVVMTGGEPLLQLDADLVAAVHEQGFRVAVETNGTIEAPHGIDWICVSPKAGATLQQTRGNELKLVYPQADLDPDDLALSSLQFDHYLLQPMDGESVRENTASAIAYCQAHPRWRLSLQAHKMVGIR